MWKKPLRKVCSSVQGWALRWRRDGRASHHLHGTALESFAILFPAFAVDALPNTALWLHTCPLHAAATQSSSMLSAAIAVPSPPDQAPARWASHALHSVLQSPASPKDKRKNLSAQAAAGLMWLVAPELQCRYQLGSRRWHSFGSNFFLSRGRHRSV